MPISFINVHHGVNTDSDQSDDDAERRRDDQLGRRLHNNSDEELTPSKKRKRKCIQAHDSDSEHEMTQPTPPRQNQVQEKMPSYKLSNNDSRMRSIDRQLFTLTSPQRRRILGIGAWIATLTFSSILTGLIEKPTPPDLRSMTSAERRTYALEVKHVKAHNLRFKRLRELMRTGQYDRLFASARPKWPVYIPSQTQMQAAKIAARALKGMRFNANLQSTSIFAGKRGRPPNNRAPARLSLRPTALRRRDESHSSNSHSQTDSPAESSSFYIDPAMLAGARVDHVKYNPIQLPSFCPDANYDNEMADMKKLAQIEQREDAKDARIALVCPIRNCRKANVNFRRMSARWNYLCSPSATTTTSVNVSSARNSRNCTNRTSTKSAKLLKSTSVKRRPSARRSRREECRKVCSSIVA